MIWSVRQLQAKCKEQKVPLYIYFIDLTKAVVLVNKEWLFATLLKIGCPQSLFNIVKSFQAKTEETVKYDGNVSESLTIKSGLKQVCVLAPIIFGIFFSMLLKRAFCSSTVGVELHTRSDGRLFNHACLKTKSKVKRITVRDLLFAYWWCCNRSSLCSRSADTNETVFIGMLRFWLHHQS